MFDSTSVQAAELLSYFGRNTAVRIDHKYESDIVDVLSARTGNIIASVDLSTLAPGIGHTLEAIALDIMAMKRFPKNRKMNKAWSPIRFSAQAKAMMEADDGIRFS